jgi:hypothetical protein
VDQVLASVLGVLNTLSCGVHTERGSNVDTVVANSQGVAITDVDPNGIAAAKGLTAGDIILDVSNNPVRTPADVHNAISRAQDSGKRDIVMPSGQETAAFNSWRYRFPLKGQRFGVASRVGFIRSSSLIPGQPVLQAAGTEWPARPLLRSLVQSFAKSGISE